MRDSLSGSIGISSFALFDKEIKVSSHQVFVILPFSWPPNGLSGFSEGNSFLKG